MTPITQKVVGGAVGLALAFAAAIAPDAELTVSRWADENRVMTRAETSRPGNWRTDHVPYLREIMDVCSPAHPAKHVVYVKPSQVGGTEVLLNMLGTIIDTAPGPAMVVRPTVDDAKDFSQDRVSAMIDACPALVSKVAKQKSREKGNTARKKDFKGGWVRFVGANSAASLRSHPVRYLLCDEVDAWPEDVGRTIKQREGNPLLLAEKRTQTFWNAKIVKVSTPTTMHGSHILADYRKSDKRKLYVPCPHCGHYQQLYFFFDERLGRGMKFKRDASGELIGDSVHYVCENCHDAIKEHHKRDMVRAGEWRPTAISADGIVGFWMNGLYALDSARNWEVLVREFLAAKDTPVEYKVFVNHVLAEGWEDRPPSRYLIDDLLGRREKYDDKSAPAGLRVLTAAIDVQDNRLEMLVKGWGSGLESWTVDRFVLAGDPRDKSADGVWSRLDAVWQRTWWGMPITCALIDSGFLTEVVYSYTSDKFFRNIWAIKGLEGWHKPIWKARPSKSARHVGALLWPVGSYMAKEAVLSNAHVRKPGPGYMHFPDDERICSRDYFKQFTAEWISFDADKNQRVWRKKAHARNEVLDLEAYNRAAIEALLMDGLCLDDTPQVAQQPQTAADSDELYDIETDALYEA